jgi:hypothetical protein
MFPCYMLNFSYSPVRDVLAHFEVEIKCAKITIQESNKCYPSKEKSAQINWYAEVSDGPINE